MPRNNRTPHLFISDVNYYYRLANTDYILVYRSHFFSFFATNFPQLNYNNIVLMTCDKGNGQRKSISQFGFLVYKAMKKRTPIQTLDAEFDGISFDYKYKL